MLSHSAFILNAFIIFLPLIFFRPFYKRKHPLFVFVLFLIPMIITMTFPVRIFDSVLDLRGIPLVIGSLSGGLYTMLLLFGSLLAYRQILGDINLFHYFLSLLPTIVLLLFLFKMYENAGAKKRMVIVAVTCFFLRVTVVNLYALLEGNASFFMASFVPSLPIIFVQCIMAVMLVFIIEMIRSQSRMQDEIIHAEKMKVVSEIAASVAHEVRNPLTSVRGFIQLMSDPALSDRKRKEFSAITLEELDRAESIISDYLSLAKPQNEKLEPIVLEEALAKAAQILNSYANLQNVEIITDIKHPATVYGSKSKFRQAIINIGKNAIEAMPGGGMLTLTYTVNEPKQIVTITITDTGIGMNEEQLNRLGSPYYTTKDKGTGLGTMVIFSVIRGMNGKIEVRSKEGEGTTYFITLPLSQHAND
ncbi:HAMP domain-containing sensor histidine kinase [Paenibacillus sp. CF384]|uniref:sensor histidine kinase n=1 Tax=Paenibacillus sp. CF384 TaxID=1884382 RepID=UPI00089A2585|nr:HAMP domain-containing sensor histidine kinase [Paenibacillus sp. CF384]SDW21212.1 two-component system, sporulation sensor kinase B [Paenibacillus sp. CF384]